MKRLFPSFVVLIAASSVSILPARAGLDQVLKPGTATQTKDDAADVRLPEYKGVKHAIGVIDFTAEDGFSFDDSARQNFRAMLESSLAATNRFVIVERGNLNAVAQEQELQASGHAAKADAAAQGGKVRSARYLATGTITEVSTETSGSGGGLEIKGFRIGGSSSKAEIVVVAKIIDSTTSEIVASERIRGKAGSAALELGYAGTDLGGTIGTFARTPLGQAAQDCINQAVRFIAGKMESMPVEGAVVAVTEDQVIINLGKEFGIGAGQTFTVRKKGEVLTDPGTGQILGSSVGGVVGTIQVANSQDKFSYCKLVNGEMPARGDVVELK
jgi:curli biogenesis system outer membrane secretion channel CsgG